MPYKHGQTTRDRIRYAVMGLNRPPKENVKWYRRKPYSVSTKLRQVIMDVLPFDCSKEQADIILRTIFETIVVGVMTDGSVRIDNFGKFYMLDKAYRTNMLKGRFKPGKKLAWFPCTSLKKSMRDEAGEKPRDGSDKTD